MNSLHQLVGWLNDAYAMERRQTKTLATHANAAVGLPEVRAQDKKHLIQTRRHAELVSRCLGLLGAKPDPIAPETEIVRAKADPADASEMGRDQLVRSFISGYAVECHEIASYRALIAAAVAMDQPEIARICGEILQEEQTMADWLEELIPEITRFALLEVVAQE